MEDRGLEGYNGEPLDGNLRSPNICFRAGRRYSRAVIGLACFWFGGYMADAVVVLTRRVRSP